MDCQSVRPADDELEETVNKYSNMLFQLCFALLCNNADAEDAVSDTFVKYITKSPCFNSEEHKKAWLIRVATNTCHDMRRFRFRHDDICLEDLGDYCVTREDCGILEEMMRLPVKYKTVLHLFYIEGYKTEEIAEILSVLPSTVRKRLQYGREKLKLECRKDGLL